MNSAICPCIYLTAWLVLTHGALGQELGTFGPLPTLPKTWVLCDQGTNRHASGTSSWVVLTNTDNGDVLSFYAEAHSDKPVPKPINQGPWTEMAISLFPGGYPAWNRPASPRIKGSSWGRNGLEDLNRGEVAVESTTVWEEESGANRLAHGYGLALGNLRLYVQHTSAKIITPELAQDLASALIELHAKRTAPAEAVRK